MKYVFYVTDQSITAYHSDGSRYVANKSFDWKQTDELDALLSSMEENAEADLILDLIDEELFFDWSPKVHLWEKQGIANRRKERLRNDTTLLTQVIWTGITRVSEEGRKEELLLSSTVAESFNLSNFLNNLEEAQIILRNIHSKAFLLNQYFNKKVRPFLKLNRVDIKKPFLMITRQSENMFRQTFFNEGELRLSRLIEVDKGYSSQAEMKKALLAETKLAITYVYNQKIIPFNSPVGFIFLDGEQSMLDGILAECQEEGLIRSTWDPNDYVVGTANFRDVSADGLNCSNDSEPCFSKQAAVDFVLSDKPKGFYENDFVQKINNLLMGRKVFIGLNIVLFLFGFYYVLITGIDSWLSWEKQKLLEQKIVQHEAEKERLQKTVQLQDDAHRIKASVEFSEAILELKVNRLINFDMNSLSEVFLKNSNIQLQKIKWKTLDRFDSKRNQVDIEAWVFPFYETYHDPVKWVDVFVDDLNKIQGIEVVQLQKEPLNRKLNQTLKINTDQGSVEALPFTVSLRIKDAKPK